MDLNKNYSLNDFYLKVSYWFVNHKTFLKKWWVILLLSVNLLMIIYILLNGVILAIRAPRYDQMVGKMTSNFISDEYRNQAKPRDLKVLQVRAISRGNDHYDFLAEIDNPNNDWGAVSFNYIFSLNGKELGGGTANINPGESKYIASQNISYTGGNFKNLSLEIKYIDWQRLVNKEILNEISFLVSDKKITSSSTDAGAASIVTATIMNQSLHGFWKVEVPVVILSAGIPIAYDTYTLRDFPSFSSKKISISWLKKLPLSAEIIISPSVNVFDESNFISP